MLEKGIVALDTETSGINFLTSQVIECSCIFCNEELEELDRKTWRINFQSDKFSWSEESAEVHGIALEDSKSHGVSVEDFIKELTSKVQSIYSGKPSIVGSNIWFDYVMLVNLWVKAGLDENDFPLNYRLIDTNSIGRFLFGKNSSGQICELLGIDVDEDKKHGAEYDAELHLKIYKALISSQK